MNLLRSTEKPVHEGASILIDSVLIDSRAVQTQPISLGFPSRMDKQQIVGVLANIIKKKKEIMKSSAAVPRLPQHVHFKVLPAAAKKTDAPQQRSKEDGSTSTVLPLIPRRQVSCKEFDERETLPKSQLKYIGLSKEKISVASKNGSNVAQISVDSPLLPRKNHSTRKPASFSGNNPDEPMLSPQKKMPSTDRKLVIRNSIDAKKVVLKKPATKKPSSFKPNTDMRLHLAKEPSVDE